MTMLERIKADSLTARKERKTVASALLTTLYSEAAMVGKNKRNDVSTDEEVQTTVQKFLKNANEVLAVAAVGTTMREETIEEIAILKGYMPTMLSEAELGDLIVKIIKAQGLPANMGKIMAELKATVSGQYDGKVASTLIRSMIEVNK